MTQSGFQRKWEMACLNLQIAMHTALMRQENGITNRWKTLARDRDRLIHQRNQLRTADDLRRIEKKRGLQ